MAHAMQVKETRKVLAALVNWTMRVPVGHLKRADRLIPRAAKLPCFRAIAGLTRSDILREAQQRGLESIEAECRATASDPTSRSVARAGDAGGVEPAGVPVTRT